MSNIVTAVFRDGATSCRAPGLWQWDYGQILLITGVELPRAVEVHFSQGDDAGTRMGVTEDGICSVAIPDIYLQEADPIDVYVYLHTGDDDGETEYHITLPIRGRTKPMDYDPEDPEVSEVYQALVGATQLLQGDIETVSEYKDAAESAATRAEKAAESFVVDDEMSETSTNAVQNRVIYQEITDLKEDLNKKISSPATPGTQGQVLTADGEGGQSWEDASGGTVTDVKVNGTSVLNAQGEAEIPLASANTPGVVVIDGTLTTSGQAADAKATGDEISQLQNGLVINSASGAITSFPDGGDNFPVRDLKAQMEPIQDLHGYDSPWPAGGGKNLVDVASPQTIISQTELARISTSEQSQFAVSATIINNASINGALNIYAYNGDTLVLSKQAVVPASASSARYSATIDMSSVEYTNLRIVISGASSGYSLTVSDVQLEKSSTATAYAPYSNICPITGRDSVKVTRTGVNVWDEEWEVGAWDSKTGAKISGVRIINKNMLRVYPGQTLFLKLWSGATNGIRLFYYDKYKNFIRASTWLVERSVTIPDNCYYINFFTADSYSTTYNHDISIKYPSTDTDYHAYQGQTYDITFPTEAGTVYGGTLDVTTGVLTVDRAMVDLGTLTWNRFNTVNDHWRFWAILNSMAKNGTMVSSQYKKIGASEQYLGAHGIASQMSGSNVLVMVSDERYDDSTTFKTAMSGVQLVYELANTITYQIPPTEIRTLLGQNNMWSDADNVSVDYVADTKLYGVTDVQVNGTSILDAETRVAKLPNIIPNGGLEVNALNNIAIVRATNNEIKAGSGLSKPIVPYNQHQSTFYGLAKAAGDTTQSASSNAVGAYTEDAKSKIHDMLDAPVTVSGTDPVITAKSGVRYVCGECATLTFTPPASGICDVTFTSGATATVLTLPSTVRWANDFDPTSLETNTTYELNIMNGLGVAVAWT